MTIPREDKFFQLSATGEESGISVFSVCIKFACFQRTERLQEVSGKDIHHLVNYAVQKR